MADSTPATPTPAPALASPAPPAPNWWILPAAVAMILAALLGAYHFWPPTAPPANVAKKVVALKKRVTKLEKKVAPTPTPATTAPASNSESRVNVDISTPAGTRVKVKVDEGAASAERPRCDLGLCAPGYTDTGSSRPLNVSRYDAPPQATSAAVPTPSQCEIWRQCSNDGRRTAPDMVGPYQPGAQAPAPPVRLAQYAPAPVYAPAPPAQPDQTTQFFGNLFGTALGVIGAVALNGGNYQPYPSYGYGYGGYGYRRSWRPGYMALVCEPYGGCYREWIQ